MKKNIVKILFIISFIINLAFLIFGIIFNKIELWIVSLASLIFQICYLIKISLPKKEVENVCVACGKNEAQPNSHICKECEDKVNGI